jgi:hypothetical protein
MAHGGPPTNFRTEMPPLLVVVMRMALPRQWQLPLPRWPSNPQQAALPLALLVLFFSSAAATCDPGYRETVGGCEACEYGTYNTLGEGYSCSAWAYSSCTAGYAFVPGNTTADTSACNPCPPGTYQSYTASTAEECTAAQFSSCGAGSFLLLSPTATYDGLCSACAPGYFQPNHNSTVGSCVPHSVVWCPAGAVFVEGNSTHDSLCDACEDGQFLALPSTGTCCCDTTPDPCTVPIPSFLGDGYCDYEPYNTEDCGWDGGDCCIETCTYQGNPCTETEAPLICRDPLCVWRLLRRCRCRWCCCCVVAARVVVVVAAAGVIAAV